MQVPEVNFRAFIYRTVSQGLSINHQNMCGLFVGGSDPTFVMQYLLFSYYYICNPASDMCSLLFSSINVLLPNINQTKILSIIF